MMTDDVDYRDDKCKSTVVSQGEQTIFWFLGSNLRDYKKGTRRKLFPASAESIARGIMN